MRLLHVNIASMRYVIASRAWWVVRAECLRVQVGDQFYEPLNILFSNRWRDVFILLAYSSMSAYSCSSSIADVGLLVFNIIATIIASRFLRYAKR